MTRMRSNNRRDDIVSKCLVMGRIEKRAFVDTESS